ncbi:hypothetical protein HQ590_10960, partial [bacterium]|nr:hypothetical protein [bacterium]
MFYFRVDLHDLQAYAEDGYLDIYVVIDAGNAANGEYALPDEVDTGTEMRWEAVVVVYSGNNGRVYLDTNHTLNSGSIGQNLGDFGVVVRDQNTLNGFGQAYFNSELDAVEFSVSRQALLEAGWNGLNPDQLNYQVFTTKDGTGNNPVGAGDIGGRTDLRDTIDDDWLASDYWKDQVNIAGNKSVLTSWFSRSGATDHGQAAKVIALVHGNQPLLPGSQIQALLNNNSGAGYYRPLDAHQAYGSPLSLQMTPATAIAIQWASADPASGRPWQDGPAFNQRLASLCQTGTVGLLGTTFAGHLPSYFPADFNRDSRTLAEAFLQDIYGVTPSATCFLPPERVVDSALLAEISSASGLDYSYGFVDQLRHLFKWFGRSTALSDAGYRINQINGTRVFVINDQASTYRFQNHDRGLDLPLRQLLLRKAQSATQDQVVILFSDWTDFLTHASADAYDLNLRWLASHPWIQVVTPDQIALGQVDITGDGSGDAWGVVDRGTGLTLPKVAKDYVDYATLEDYDNWYNGLAGQREGLCDKVFQIRSGTPMPAAFGQVGVNGIASQAWARVSNLDSNILAGPLGQLARGTSQAAMFITAFHQQSPVDLSKFSTGDYINPAYGYQTLTAYAAFSQAQARSVALYERVAGWAAAPPAVALREALDVDLDGEPEYLLYNPQVLALFEAIGGRLVAAFARDPESGRVCQMLGNLAGYAGRETEQEGDTNLQAGDVDAYRTSGFKDLFAQTGGPGVGTTQYVNDLYTVAAAPSGVGWTFSSSDDNIVKTIRLGDSDGRLEASYTLAGGINKLYLRHGLSPDLLALWRDGQANLTGPTPSNGVLTVRNDAPDSVAVARLHLGNAGHSNVLENAAAIDGTNAFATVNMRNQAHTQQVELESTATSFSFALELAAA